MFSNSTQYAIRTILYLAKNQKEGDRFKSDYLSKELEIPSAYLGKILQQLAKNRIINSSKGPGGGFYISKENSDRPLLDAVICMEGHNIFDQCILGLAECSEKNPCPLHTLYDKMKVNLEQTISKVSISDISKELSLF